MNDTDTITRLVISIDPKEPEPRALAEIHAEVGFPFSARKVQLVDGYPKQLPVGFEGTFTLSMNPGFYISKESTELDCEVDATRKAWILLGHK